jgi:glycosyltransferase involved in cell wall biosynthesis
MRFGILTQYYPPEMGAPQARLSELAARFVDHGHEVTVLTAMPNYPTGKIRPGYGGLFRRDAMEGVGVKRCWIYPSNSVHRLPRLASYASFVASSTALGAFMLPRPDYFLTESPPLFLGISGYVLARLKRARWIFNVSDLWPESAVRLGMIGRGAALELAERLEAWCYRKAWLVSGQSVGILADIHARFPGVPTYHLSNGVDTTMFTPEARQPALRCGLGDPDECVVMYAGLHGIAQGLDQVLETAYRIDSQLRTRFVFVGDGPEKRGLIGKARDLGLRNVSFLDPVPRQDIPALLNAADIAVVPLKLDLPGAVPSKLYEAMAVGIPIVFVGEGEPAAIVRETKSGLVVRPGNVSDLEAAVRRLAADPEFRAECGNNGRRAAIERFDRRRIADAFIAYLEDRLGSNRTMQTATQYASAAKSAGD